MENKQFSTKNPLRILYLVDQSKSTELRAADGTPICNHFAKTTNDGINNMITKNSNGTRVTDRATISVATFCGKGVEFVCEGRLSELADNPTQTIMEDQNTIPTPVYIMPNAYGDSPLGRALENDYNKWTTIAPDSFNNYPNYYASYPNMDKGQTVSEISILQPGSFYIMTDALSEWLCNQKGDALSIIKTWENQQMF